MKAQQGFEKYFGTSGANNSGYGVIESDDGGFFICGSSDSDGILVKTDASGNVMWQQNYPNGSFESIRRTKDFGYILAGTDYNPPYAAVYRKIDSLGNVQWNKILNSGSFSHYGISAMETADGNFALLENDTYPFQEYMRVWKIDSGNQNSYWTTEINKVSNCSPGSFISSHDSSIVVACGDFSFQFPHLIFAKVSIDSTMTWKKDYGFTSTVNAGLAGNSVIETNDSGFLIVGYKVTGNPQSDYSLLLMKTDGNGDSLWTRNYFLRNSNDFPSVIQTTDGGFAFIATLQYPSSGGPFDYRVLLMKTNNSGDSLWSKEFTGLGLNQAQQLIQTHDGGFAIAGTSTDQNTGENFLYLIKTDSLGDLITKASEMIQAENEFSVFPNPAKDHVTIKLLHPDNNQQQKIELLDMYGRIVLEQKLCTTETIINTINFAKGIYFVRLYDNKQSFFQKKIIVQ